MNIVILYILSIFAIIFSYGVFLFITWYRNSHKNAPVIYLTSNSAVNRKFSLGSLSKFRLKNQRDRYSLLRKDDKLPKSILKKHKPIGIGTKLDIAFHGLMNLFENYNDEMEVNSTRQQLNLPRKLSKPENIAGSEHSDYTDSGLSTMSSSEGAIETSNNDNYKSTLDAKPKYGDSRIPAFPPKHQTFHDSNIAVDLSTRQKASLDKNMYDVINDTNNSFSKDGTIPYFHPNYTTSNSSFNDSADQGISSAYSFGTNFANIRKQQPVRNAPSTTCITVKHASTASPTNGSLDGHSKRPVSYNGITSRSSYHGNIFRYYHLYATQKPSNLYTKTQHMVNTTNSATAATSITTKSNTNTTTADAIANTYTNTYANTTDSNAINTNKTIFNTSDDDMNMLSKWIDEEDAYLMKNHTIKNGVSDNTYLKFTLQQSIVQEKKSFHALYKWENNQKNNGYIPSSLILPNVNTLTSPPPTAPTAMKANTYHVNKNGSLNLGATLDLESDTSETKRRVTDYHSSIGGDDWSSSEDATENSDEEDGTTAASSTTAGSSSNAPPAHSATGTGSRHSSTGESTLYHSPYLSFKKESSHNKLASSMSPLTPSISTTSSYY